MPGSVDIPPGQVRARLAGGSLRALRCAGGRQAGAAVMCRWPPPGEDARFTRSGREARGILAARLSG